MRKDCSKTEIFLAEWSRMCGSMECGKCPMLDSDNGLCNVSKKYWDDTNINVSKDIVQKWSDNHLEKTLADKFFEMFPDAPRASGNIPCSCCPSSFGWAEDIENCWSDEACIACWHRVYKEVH